MPKHGVKSVSRIDTLLQFDVAALAGRIAPARWLNHDAQRRERAYTAGATRR
jgi:hypothetical protein